MKSIAEIFDNSKELLDSTSISLLTKSLKICYNSGEILFIYQIRGVS